MLVSYRLRVAKYSVWCFGSIRPEIEDDPICLGRNRGNFHGLSLRHIENLNATDGDLDPVVMSTYSWSSRVYVRARLTWLSSARQGTMTQISAELHQRDYTNAQPCAELGNPPVPHELLTSRLLKKSASATERGA
jgi:hypothetical protein